MLRFVRYFALITFRCCSARCPDGCEDHGMKMYFFQLSLSICKRQSVVQENVRMGDVCATRII